MGHLKKIFFCLSALCLLTGCTEIINGPEIGGDWHTWRGYSNDISLTSDLSVTFSRFHSELNPGCVGFAMYDALSGARIGTILLSRDDSDHLPQSFDFVADDRDGDGVAEIGIPLEDGTLVWFRFGYADTWQENILETADRSNSEETPQR